MLKNLDWIVPIGADVRYKQFGLAADLFAAKISGATVTPHETLFTTSDIEMKLAIVNLLGYVRLVEDERFSFDLMGGAPYLYVKQTLDLSGGLVGRRAGTVQSVANPKLWDGVVGARLDCALTDQLSILTYGDVGTGNSDLTWQVWANLVYHFTDNFSLGGGYRYLTRDGGEDDTDVRLTLSGPVVTFLFHF